MQNIQTLIQQLINNGIGNPFQQQTQEKPLKKLPELKLNYRNNKVSQTQLNIIELLDDLANPQKKNQKNKKKSVDSQISQENQEQQQQEEEDWEDLDDNLESGSASMEIESEQPQPQIQNEKSKKPEEKQNDQQNWVKEQNPQQYFEDVVLFNLFNIPVKKVNLQLVQMRIKQIQSFGNSNKGFCGKILRKNDIGFKCLDCEMDPTCIICKECFEKGDHKGHRVFPQQGCQGCCDCGDPEAWKPAGFCKDHCGFVEESELDLNVIPPQIRSKFYEVFGEIFYQIFYMCEKYEETIQNSKKDEEKDHQHLSDLLSFTIKLLQKIIGGNLLLTYLVYDLLKKNFQQIKQDQQQQLLQQQQVEDEMLFHHNWENLHENEFNFQVLQRSECNLVELLFRFNFSFDKNCMKLVQEFFITQMFSLYSFKQFLIVTYTRMFNFLVFKGQQQKKKKSENNEWKLSKLVDIDVQLFTSDELAIKAIEQKEYFFIFEVSQALINLGTNNNCEEFYYSHFWKIFHHIKYSGMKPGSMNSFIKKEGVLQSMTSLIKSLQYCAKFQLRSEIRGDDSIFQKQTDFINVEIQVNEVIKSMVARILSDQEFADNKYKILGSWIKLLIKGMEEICSSEQDIEKQKFSTIFIPLHRTLSLLIFSYFQLDLNNISYNNMEKVKEFLQDVGIELVDLVKFFRYQMIIPLQVYSFVKEIDRKIWVYHGQQIEFLSNLYNKGSFGLLNSDMLFIEISLLFCKIYAQNNSPSLNNNSKEQKMEEEIQEKQGEKAVLKEIFSDLLVNFSNKHYWKLIIQNKVELKKLDSKAVDQFEKYLGLVGDFFSFLCFLQLDEVSSYNIIQNLFKEEDENGEEANTQSNRKNIGSFKNIAISYMQCFQSKDLKGIKKALTGGYLSSKENFDFQIADVSNFDKVKKQFSLKNQYRNFFVEQYLFINCSGIFNFYNDYLNQKYSKDEQRHKMILGTMSEKFQKQGYLRNISQILMDCDEFSTFLSVFSMSQLFERGFMKSHYLNNLMHPLLKLIYMSNQEYMKIMDEENTSIQDNSSFNGNQFGKIGDFLQKIRVNEDLGLSLENKETILFVQNYLQQLKVKLMPEGEDGEKLGMVEEIDNQADLSLKKKKSKEENRKKQQKLLQKFKMKSEQFLSRHSSTVNSEVSDMEQSMLEEQIQEELPECVICKEKMNENYGMCAYVSKTNIHQHAKFQMHMNQAIKISNQVLGEYVNRFSDKEDDYWRINDGDLQYSSCLHQIHQSCYQQYIRDKKVRGQEQYQFMCPLCNRFCNIFIMNISQKDTDIFGTYQPVSEDKNEEKDNQTSEIEEENSKKLSSEVIEEEEENNEKEEEEEKTQDEQQFVIDSKNLKKLPKFTQKDLKLLQNYSDKEKIVKDEEFSKLNVVYDKYHVCCQQKGQYKQFVEDVNSFANTLQTIFLTEYEEEQSGSENQILYFFESSFTNAIQSIDILGVKEFSHQKLAILKNLYGISRVFLANFESNTKGLFLSQKLQELVDILKYQSKYEWNKKNQGQNRQFSIITQDLERVLVSFMVNCGLYFVEMVKNTKLLENLVLYLIFARIQQINIANKTEKYRENLGEALKDESYIKQINPILRKYLCFLLIVKNYPQNSYKRIEQFCEYSVELEYIMDLVGLNQAKLVSFYSENKMHLDSLYFDLEEKIQERVKSKQISSVFLPLVSVGEEFRFNFINLEHKFGDIYQQYHGAKCVYCKDFPRFQELCVCLICGETMCSITCENQFESNKTGRLNEHAKEYHFGGSVFMSLKDGKVYLVKSPKNMVDEYLYYDEYGQHFKTSAKNWNSFYLDTDIFNSLKKIVCGETIAQEVYYKQTKYDKYYKDAVF